MINTESPERQSKEKRQSGKVQRKPFNQSSSTKSSDDADAIIDKRMSDRLSFSTSAISPKLRTNAPSLLRTTNIKKEVSDEHGRNDPRITERSTYAKSRRNDLSGVLGKEKLQLQDRLRKGRRSLSSDDLTVDAEFARKSATPKKPGRTKQGTETQDELHRQSQQLRKPTLTQKPRRTSQEKETFAERRITKLNSPGIEGINERPGGPTPKIRISSITQKSRRSNQDYATESLSSPTVLPKKSVRSKLSAPHPSSSKLAGKKVPRHFMEPGSKLGLSKYADDSDGSNSSDKEDP